MKEDLKRVKAVIREKLGVSLDENTDFGFRRPKNDKKRARY